jgi:hypothetical protein
VPLGNSGISSNARSTSSARKQWYMLRSGTSNIFFDLLEDISNDKDALTFSDYPFDNESVVDEGTCASGIRVSNIGLNFGHDNMSRDI